LGVAGLNFAAGLLVVPPWIVLSVLPDCGTSVLLTSGAVVGRVGAVIGGMNVSEKIHTSLPLGRRAE
jgi:cell division protein FtsW (lipid II flippase)